MSTPRVEARPVALAVWLLAAGAIGWWAAFSLTTEKLHLLATPGAAASCDFSVLIQCGRNLDSWQGSLFGFPNPVLGLTGWVAPIVVGAALLAGARFARWFWLLFALGITAAFVFVLWLVGQSIYVLGTLCPWCMVTWVVTIPTFYAVAIHVIRRGDLGLPGMTRRLADRLAAWVPLLSLLSYTLIAVLAQLRLDVLATL